MINLAHILKNKIEEYNCYGYCNYTNISNNDIAILAVFKLHHDKIINDDRLKAYCAQYRNNTLVRKINTYHCRINNEWYNDTSSFEPLMDSYFHKCDGVDLPVDVLLGYLNKLLNRNKNYCIDHLYFTYYKPIINQCDAPSDIAFSSFNHDLDFPSYEYLDSKGILSSGYCCRDCDGCLGEYKRNAYRSYIGYNWREKIDTEVKKFLISKKTKEYYKNPHNLLTV